MLITNDCELTHTIFGNIKNSSTPKAAFQIDESIATADGVYLLRNYRMIYQIEEAGAILPKKVVFNRTGQEVIDDLSMLSANFRQLYNGPSSTYLVSLRSYVRNIVSVGSTLAIMGNSKKTVRQLRKSASCVDVMMQDMNSASWQMFYEATQGAYMFFHIAGSDTRHNTYTLTDVQSMSPSDIDLYLSRVNRDSSLFRLHGEDEIRKRLQYGQIHRESSYQV